MHNSLRILTCITLLCFSFSMFAQFEKIIEQPENPYIFNTYILGNTIYTHVQHEISFRDYESFVVKGDENMENRDSLNGMTLRQGKAMFCLCSPIGDSIFPVIVAKLSGPQDYETDLVFVDTSLNVVAVKSLSVTKATPNECAMVNDSVMYLYGHDALGNQDFYIGKYHLNGDLIKDSIYSGRKRIKGLIERQDGKVVLLTAYEEFLLNNETFSITPLLSGFRGGGKHQIFKHANNHLYMTGWLPPHGSLPLATIGIYVMKLNNDGSVVDSIAIVESRGQDVQTVFKEGCLLSNGDLLLPYRWDSIPNSDVPYLRIMIVDENLNVKRTIKRFFDRDFFVSSSAALSDGGAVVFGRILDTVDFGYDTYFLRLDSLGNFSPLTIIDDVAPKVTSLSLYPNPADDHIFIKGIDDQALIDVLVMNEAGQLEQKTQLSYPFKLETSDLPSGVYTLLLLGAEGNNTSLKMVKN